MLPAINFSGFFTPRLVNFSDLTAWGKSGSKDSILRSEILLRELESNPRIKPNVLSYSGVITCMAKSKESNMAKRAEALLGRMEEREEFGGESPDNSKLTAP